MAKSSKGVNQSATAEGPGNRYMEFVAVAVATGQITQCGSQARTPPLDRVGKDQAQERVGTTMGTRAGGCGIGNEVSMCGHQCGEILHLLCTHGRGGTDPINTGDLPAGPGHVHVRGGWVLDGQSGDQIVVGLVWTRVSKIRSCRQRSPR